MVPGVSKRANIILLVVFTIVIALPIITGHTEQPYLAYYHIFSGGIIGAAWGRGVHASLEGRHYGMAGALLFVVWLFFVLPVLV
jgi:hypothetical protein